MKYFDFSLECGLYDALSIDTETQNYSKDDVVLIALKSYLRQTCQAKIKNEMRQYAQEMAEYSDEFISKYDNLISQNLLAATEW